MADALGISGHAGFSGRATILRTSWVYGPVGRNFLLTMLRLHHQKATSYEPLRVVADQLGCPTSTAGLTKACWAAIERQATGILHWSDSGVASWYDFAVAIGELGEQLGLLEQAAKVQPICTADTTPRPSDPAIPCSTPPQRVSSCISLPSIGVMHSRKRLQNTDSLNQLIQAAKA